MANKFRKAVGRGWKFGIAAISHALKGNPTCTQEEINHRLSICKQCKHFTGNHCLKCGCNCGNNPKKYLNKLAWADQECPIKKWCKIDRNETPKEE
jgi:hypothetical protein